MHILNFLHFGWGWTFCLLFWIMFSHNFHRIDVVKQVILVVEALIGLASVTSKSKAENVELTNSIESQDQTPDKELRQNPQKES